MNSSNLLELKNISFSKNNIDIINNLNFDIRSGEIHAIVGDRGTGKSSLGLIMGLYERPDKGSIFWKGNKISFSYFKPVKNPGIQIIHQHEGLIDYFTVAENLFIPEKIFRPLPFKGRKKMIMEAESLIHGHGFSIDPLSTFQSLTMSEKVVVDFLRCIYRKPELLILDETLEKFTGKDLDQIILLLKELSEKGMAIICISHRIDDIYNLARKVSIIRDGKILLTDATKNIDRLNLIKMCYTQITRNKKSEDINKEFYQLLRYNEAILKNLPIALIVTDDQNNIKMINDQGQNFFDTEPDKYLDQPMSSIITDSDSLKQIQNCFNIKKETSIIHQNISDVMTNIKIFPIFDGTFPIGNITIIEDITDQEKMRQRVNLSENLASLGLLAAGVAHEINNPLEIIYNYLSFLRMYPDRKQSLDAVKQLEEEIDGIKHIVSNLVSFSGSKEQHPEIFDVNDLIEQTLKLLKPAAKERNIQYSSLYTTGELLICANKTEIRQVLMNIIRNSFEVLKSAGKMHIETKIIEEQAIILISDNGPGINVKDSDHIFLPFYSTKKNENNNNLGLGLPMSYGIVKKYKGELSYRNMEDKGCEFIIKLPLVTDKI